MKRARSHLCAGLAFALSCALPVTAAAQSDDQIYTWETPQSGWVELKMLNAFVLDSTAEYERFEHASSRAGLEQHFLELGYGLTDRWEVGAYSDFELSPGGPFRYSGVRVESNYRLFDRYQRVVELGLHAEVVVPRPSSGDPEELETRLILQRDLGDFRLIANPGFEHALSGGAARDGFEFAIGGGLYWRRFWRVQPAVEYFGDIGAVADPPPARKQRHVVYLGARVNLLPGLSWLLTAGAGLDRASDRFLARGILSYEFETVRPSEQAR